MPTLEELVEDGLEELGAIELSGAVSVGDPGAMLASQGGGRAFAVREGRWLLLGRPWPADPDRLEELIAVHEPALGRFYDLYDGAIVQAELPSASRRVALIDGQVRAQGESLLNLLETDLEALPWVLDRGVVVAALPGNPAWILAPRGPVVALLSILLERPMQEARPDYAAESPDEDDEDEIGDN